MVFDIAWQPLQWGITKGITYYHQRTKWWTYKVHLSEELLFREASKQIHRFTPSPIFSVLIEAHLREKLGDTIKEQDRNLNVIRWEIDNLKKLIDGLIVRVGLATSEVLIKNYEDKITSATEELESKNRTLLSEEQSVKEKDIVGTAKMYADLFKDLPGTFQKVSKKEKADILRWLWVSFIVWPDWYITLIGWDFEKLFTL